MKGSKYSADAAFPHLHLKSSAHKVSYSRQTLYSRGFSLLKTLEQALEADQHALQQAAGNHGWVVL